MSDYLDQYFERMEDDDPTEVRCKRCCSTDVIWENHNGKWVLLSIGGRPHRCDTKIIVPKREAFTL